MIIDKAIGIPTMTTKVVHEYLEEIGRQWIGQGVAMELGCFMGASSVPLLRGLVKAGYNKAFWAFDRWRANEQQVGMAEEYGIKLAEGDSVLSYYINNTTEIYSDIVGKQGGIPNILTKYCGDPIEICILDAPKKNPVFINTIKALHKYWIPGTTILGLLDYEFYKRKVGPLREVLKASVRFMEEHKDSFELIKQWDNECPRFYKYIKPLRNI